MTCVSDSHGDCALNYFRPFSVYNLVKMLHVSHGFLS